MRASVEDCFAVVSDLERYPAWAADVKAVTIDRLDSSGRAQMATFRVAAFGRSTTVTLSYDYSAAPRRLSWVQTNGDITSRYDGTYEFERVEGGETEVTYHLEVEMRVPIPGFVKRRAESRLISTALRELKARVEQDAPAQTSGETTRVS